MATKALTLNSNFQLITNAQAYIQFKHIGNTQYFTTPTEQPDPLNATPTDADALIDASESFPYPGGDYMYMKLVESSADNFKIAVDEVA